MAKQTKAELDALIAEAGVSKATAKKLHKANGTDGDAAPAAEPSRPRGHGAAAPVKPDLGDF